jgi:uncharacterized protein (TIGR03437 family)
VALCTISHAAGTIFSTLLRGSGQEFASALTSDSQGNTYVAGLTFSPDFPVTDAASQATFGGTSDAFVAKLGPDGKVIWATYLGGILDDWASGIALDSAGNVWVAGWTRSPNFPLVNPLQSMLDGGATDDYDAFVAEFDPTGSKLLFSTFLGGAMLDGAAGIAIDAANNVYVAVNSYSESGYPGAAAQPANTPGINVTKLSPKGAVVYTFFHPSGVAHAIALDAAGAVYVAGTTAVVDDIGPPGKGNAVVFKLAPDGTGTLYEKTFGGSYSASANAVAVNSAGEAWVAGVTQSADFPVVHGLQTTLGARLLWQSTNSGATWTPIDDLPFALPQGLVVDPATPTTLYEATGDRGVWKSTDGGTTWTQSSSGISGASVQAIAIDPAHPKTLYAATSSTVYKSTDGAATWTAIDSPPWAVASLQIDAQNPNIVYESGQAIRKSTDAGATWNPVAFPAVFASMALDPNASGHIIAISNFFFCGFSCSQNKSPQMFFSTDGGNSWTLESTPPASTAGIVVDASTKPSTVYDGLQYISTDGGVTFTPLPAPPFGTSNFTVLAVDPSGALYAAVQGGPVYVSKNHAQSWTALTSPVENGGLALTSLVSAGSSGVLYSLVYLSPSAGFVTRLSADGNTLEYSTYLRGHSQIETGPVYLAEPPTMVLQNWIAGIALDSAGNVVLAGGTRAVDFPTANPVQPAVAGLADAFAAILSPDGSRLQFSTYFGGSQDDGTLAATVDSTGNVIFAGQTWSGDFPTGANSTLPFTFGDAFVVKLATGAPAIVSVSNGASFQPGIEAGSWVMIKGVNLANTTRSWTDADFNGNQLPTSLSGVSVTIDGQSAFPSYISPTQINVIAPSTSTTGSVNVVVDNHGALSAPAAAQMQTYAPAFFIHPGTNFAFASLLPDYAPSADPSIVTGATAAHPGDILVLWATGFGPTTPPAPAALIVSGVPVAITPSVTVGGVPVKVLNSILAVGSAGLYQITIQLPANVPTGAVAIQASLGGAQTQSGATIFIAQ